jgi:hypothetical protein
VPALAPGKPIKPKKTCCKDKPRCKRCPVVLKKLAKAGYGERREDGKYVFETAVPKQAVKSARKR